MVNALKLACEIDGHAAAAGRCLSTPRAGRAFSTWTLCPETLAAARLEYIGRPRPGKV